ncbi:MAG: DUF1778 domain-containing protein [Solirubrobacteraceae bacterium]|jgi:uncharacterized protein (DUF1778 family)
MTSTTTRSRRIDVRVTDEQDAIIREAAMLAGETLTAFLLSAAQERARELLDERRHLVMSDHAFERFAEALEAPAERAPALTELFRLPRIAGE